MQLTFDASGLSGRDRAGFTLFGSALAHIVIIMGIGFTFTLGQSENRELSSIATTLATSRTSEDVSDAEIFAQASQEGGGLGDDADPLRSPLPLINDPRTQAESISPAATDPVDSGIEDVFLYVTLPDTILLALESQKETNESNTDAPEQSGAEAMIRSPLAAEFDTEFSGGALVPRQKFISSRTQEHKYATYMEAWRSRVEQVGNTNYPDEARNRRLSGNLVLTVAIRANGEIADIDVVRSSGQKILDDAAVRIVMMAAPFDDFPDEILKEADVIHITRTWQFLHNSTLIQN